MRVAVIGCGSIGTRHARNIKALGHDVIVHDLQWAMPIHDPAFDQMTIATSMSNATYNADAVLICTPASTHAAVARELLASGYCRALFVEKPLALSVEECNVFNNWPHPTTMVGYMLRREEHAAAMKAVVPAPTWIDCSLECDMASWPGSDYADLIFEGSHEIDLALWLGGEPHVETATIDQTRVELRGRNWAVRLNGAATVYRREWSASGGLCGYQWGFRSPDDLGPSMYIAELTHFLDCVARGVHTETPFADGLRVLTVIEQAKAMAACQKS